METYAGVDEFAQFSNTLSAYKQFNKEESQLNFPLLISSPAPLSPSEKPGQCGGKSGKILPSRRDCVQYNFSSVR